MLRLAGDYQLYLIADTTGGCIMQLLFGGENFLCNLEVWDDQFTWYVLNSHGRVCMALGKSCCCVVAQSTINQLSQSSIWEQGRSILPYYWSKCCGFRGCNVVQTLEVASIFYHNRPPVYSAGHEADALRQKQALLRKSCWNPWKPFLIPNTNVSKSMRKHKDQCIQGWADLCSLKFSPPFKPQWPSRWLQYGRSLDADKREEDTTRHSWTPRLTKN